MIRALQVIGWFFAFAAMCILTPIALLLATPSYVVLWVVKRLERALE
jgi:hypothetical protein